MLETILDDAHGKVNYFYSVYYGWAMVFLLARAASCAGVCSSLPVNTVPRIPKELRANLEPVSPRTNTSCYEPGFSFCLLTLIV